jgi:hypothetical protein
MSYHFRFALKLERQENQVFYNPEAFVDDGIDISVPEIQQLVNRFVEKLKPVAVVERKRKENAECLKEVNAENNRIEPSDHNSGRTPVSLNPVEAEAYVCKAKELDKSSLESLCSEATAYLTTTSSKISRKDFLSNELDTFFAGIRELYDLRNYLLTYLKNPQTKKKYQEGYIYITMD